MGKAHNHFDWDCCDANSHLQRMGWPSYSSFFLLFLVATMLLARQTRIPEKQNNIVICTGSNQTTVESVVSAQQGLRTVHEIIQNINISILKIWSILVSKAPKHADTVMIAMSSGSILFMVVPFKFILMALVSYGSVMASPLGKRMQNEQSNRRLREWWDSIPVTPVEIVDCSK